MKLPLGMGNLDFGQWAYGLLAAFIGGGAGALSGGLAAIVVDPKDFNIFEVRFLELIATAFVFSGLTPFFALLHQKPLPNLKQVDKTLQTTIPATADSPKIVETIRERHLEPIDAAAKGPDNAQ